MYKQQLEEYFDKNRDALVKDICDLIEIKSCRGDAKPGMPFGEGPSKALEHALNLAAGMGFNVENHEGYVGTVDMNTNPTELGILAHLDVVPEGIGWTMNPYKPVVKNGRIYGRGSSDDKGPAMVALYALKAVKDLGIPLSKNVRLILGTDEECGSSDIAHYFASHDAPPNVFSPDGNFPVVNIEKGRIEGNMSVSFREANVAKKIVEINGGVKANVVPQIVYAVVSGFTVDEIEDIAKKETELTGVNFELSKQANLVRIDVEGQSGHAAYPHQGNNAITALLSLLSKISLDDSKQADVIKGLSKLFPHGDYLGNAMGIARSDEKSGVTTLSFNIINYIDNKLTGVFDSRIAIGGTKENTLEVIRKNLADIDVTLEADFIDLHVVDENSEFIQTLLSKYEKYSGNDGYCVSTGGGTYVHNIDGGVAFGCCLPNTDTHMHGADEFMNISELIMSAKIFAECIIDICK